MANINTVVLSGRLGGDPEMKYFESGKAKASFSLGVNEWSKKESKELVNWFEIEVWEKQAEFVGEYAKKGTKATVLGRLKASTWQDDSGNAKKKIIIVAETVEFERQRGD